MDGRIRGANDVVAEADRIEGLATKAITGDLEALNKLQEEVFPIMRTSNSKYRDAINAQLAWITTHIGKLRAVW